MNIDLKIFLFVFIGLFISIHSNGQTILDSIYLEKDQGLRSRIINHVIRDNKGYFYLFFDNGIQKFDGEHFDDINVDILLGSDHKMSNVSSVSLSKDGKININIPNVTDRIFIKPGATTVSKGIINKNQHLSFIGTTEIFRHSYESSSSERKITVNGTSYIWKETAVYKEANGNIIELHKLPHGNSKPIFFNVDKKGNIIAAYSNRSRYVDHYYILDHQEKLHDFTFLAKHYETASDVYSDDVFYKWMIVGYNGMEIVTLRRDGINFSQRTDHVEKGKFGRIISGIASDGITVFASSESKIIFKKDSTYNFNQTGTNHSFISDGFLSLHYNPFENKFYQIGYNISGITDLISFRKDFLSPETITLPYKIKTIYFHSKSLIIAVGSDEEKEIGVILQINPQTKKVQQTHIDTPPLYSIYYDDDLSEFWIGSERGLFVYDKDWRLLKKFIRSEKGNHLRYPNITVLNKFQNKIIAGSEGGGLYIFDPKDKKLEKQLNVKNGLTDDIVIGLIEDNEENFWISTFNGLNVIDTNFNIIKRIYEHHGLPNREFNFHSVAKDDAGLLYFGSLNGICQLNPTDILEWEESYQLSLDRITSYTKNGSVHIEDMHAAIIDDSCDSLIIDYSVNDYYKYPYANVNVGVSSSWSELKFNHVNNRFTFRDLKKGPLDISLKPDFHPEIKKINIEVRKDFMPIINLLGILLGIVIFTTFLVVAILNYIQEREREKSKITKNISELRLSALQSQMNPHFIFNALGAIQYFIKTNNSEKADDYLSDFAILIRGILDSSNKKHITLKEELKLIKLYVGLEKSRFENKFDVEFLVDRNIDMESLLPPMLIQPIIENSINHGLHHLKERKGKLNINLKSTNTDQFIIEIIDNGIGRKEAEKKKIKKNHQSRAMGIIKDRIETINKSRDLAINLMIEDLYEGTNSIGTKVILTFDD